MKKSELPTKLCVRCGLLFAWRKKWEKCWSEVKYCSERCRRDYPKVTFNSLVGSDVPRKNRKQ